MDKKCININGKCCDFAITCDFRTFDYLKMTQNDQIWVKNALFASRTHKSKKLSYFLLSVYFCYNLITTMCVAYQSSFF